MPDFLPVSPAEIQGTAKDILLHQDMSGRHNIFQTTQPGKQLNILESPGQTKTGGSIRANPGYSPLLKIYSTLLRFIEAVYAVQQAGLAGAVWPDNSQNLIISYIQADIGKGFHTPEGKKEVFNPYLHTVFASHFRHSLLTPSGK